MDTLKGNGNGSGASKLTPGIKEAAAGVGSSICYNYRFVPLSISATTISIAVIEGEDDEDRRLAIDAATRRRPEIVETWKEEELYRVLGELFPKRPSQFVQQSEDKDVAKWLEDTIETTIRRHATDLHIEHRKGRSNDSASDGKTTVLIRIDRALHQIAELPGDFGRRAINAVRRKAEMSDDDPLADGAFEVVTTDGQTMQCRVQILPDFRGTDAVLRFNGSALRLYTLDELGIPDLALKYLKETFNAPGGLHVIAGPVNSGKTTTRAAVISYLLKLLGGKHRAKAITGEDPVEIPIENATQIQINEAQGVTYAAIARAGVRSDCDIGGAGEVRDEETADASIAFGLAGRHFAATLHATDAISSVRRFLYFKVAPEMLDETLRTVIAQRMLPLICPSCREEPRLVTNDEKVRLARAIDGVVTVPKQVWEEGPGCTTCHGYGRIGQIPVFEVLIVTRRIGAGILAGLSYGKLREEALAAQMGYMPMLFQALELVKEGRVSLSSLFQEVYCA